MSKSKSLSNIWSGILFVVRLELIYEIKLKSFTANLMKIQCVKKKCGDFPRKWHKHIIAWMKITIYFLRIWNTKKKKTIKSKKIEVYLENREILANLHNLTFPLDILLFARWILHTSLRRIVWWKQRKEFTKKKN